MAGLIVIGVVIAYVALFWVIVAKTKSWAMRVGTVAVAIAIPFWDYPVGYFSLLSHCRDDAGIKTFQKWPPTKSVLITPGGGYTPEETARYGVPIVEYSQSGRYARFTSATNGFSKSIHDVPMSTIAFSWLPNSKLPWNIEKSTIVARELATGRVVATETSYRWQGMWWQVLGKPGFGGGKSCPGAPGRPLIEVVAAGIK